MHSPRIRERRIGHAARSLAVAVTSGLVVAACGGGGGAGDPTAADDGGQAISRPVTVVVPFGPGGGADSVSRAAGQVMEREIGVGMPVINVDGGTGSTGMTRMLSGNPDESIATLIQDTLATIPAGSAAFALEDIRAVCRLQEMPSALFVRKGTYADWEELKAAASQQPGELQAATVGTGGVDDIVLAALAQAHGTEFRPVPYADPSERYAALLGGAADVMYEQLGDVREYIESGDIVPVMVFSTEPVQGYEDVPLSTDLGVPEEVILPQFRGFVASADASDSVVQQLSDACAAAVEDPKFQEFQRQVYSTEDSYQPADEFQSFLEQQEQEISGLLEKYQVQTSG
jgi:tripartite-type tricarboxylate transporter receptor subunit TctC